MARIFPYKNKIDEIRENTAHREPTENLKKGK